MLNRIIDTYKSVRKNNMLRKASDKAFAFIGVGQHSLSNLYPVIDFLGINLKYIYSRSEETAQLAAAKFRCIGTNDLDTILADNNIKGLFICSAPQAHFELVKKALIAGKEVFVEKPPCFTVAQLHELDQLSQNRVVQVGLQKRYAQVYQQIKKISDQASQYQLKFVTGSHPEGDVLMDLFIHPIDLVNFLFGEATNIQKLHTDTGSYFVQIQHKNGTIGQLTLSTEGSWVSPEESLVVTTKKGTYRTQGLHYLEYEKKPHKVGPIPLEKVIKTVPQKDILVNQNGFVPIAENNSLSIQGYYGEVAAFIKACNGRKAELTTLKKLKETYLILNEIGS